EEKFWRYPDRSATWMIARGARSRLLVMASLRLDPGVLDHLAPFAELLLHKFGELLGRARKCLEARIAEGRFDLRAVDDLAQLGVEQRDDIRGRAGRRENAGPRIHVEPCHSSLVERGQFGDQRRALDPGHG